MFRCDKFMSILDLGTYLIVTHIHTYSLIVTVLLLKICHLYFDVVLAENGLNASELFLQF